MDMLRISKLTDYAILVMVELARDGEVLSAHALAARVGVETRAEGGREQRRDGPEADIGPEGLAVTGSL